MFNLNLIKSYNIAQRIRNQNKIKPYIADGYDYYQNTEGEGINELSCFGNTKNYILSINMETLDKLYKKIRRNKKRSPDLILFNISSTYFRRAYKIN
ncbi:hypothetical protein [Chryseobacterium sp. Tr-659]|uniref:hypothetical protein n=1 Tax=Chryseobacterium sp. Tr-659 TaxID=2608340 RepID=UPI00141E424B|nr:hypothetical protein [Chryseobacterium sp. Tr-659]